MIRLPRDLVARHEHSREYGRLEGVDARDRTLRDRDVRIAVISPELRGHRVADREARALARPHLVDELDGHRNREPLHQDLATARRHERHPADAEAVAHTTTRPQHCNFLPAKVIQRFARTHPDHLHAALEPDAERAGSKPEQRLERG